MQDPDLGNASSNWSALRPSYETETLVYRDLHVTVRYATAMRGSRLIIRGERDATGLQHTHNRNSHAILTVRRCAGLMVWSGSHLLCYYLESLGRTTNCIDTVLELGSGVGLCSAVAVMAGACSYLCTTDAAGPVLDLAAQNLRVAENAAKASAKSVEWTVAQLNWGDEVQIERILGTLPEQRHTSEKRFGTVLAAEIIYPDIDVLTLHQLFKTVDMVLVQGGEFICAFVERNSSSVMCMIEVADSLGWQLAIIPGADFLPSSICHAMEGAKLLKFSRAAPGCNGALGGVDCCIFPGLKARLERMSKATEQAEEWVAPFADEECMYV